MKEKILDQLDLYIWAKDKSYKYIFCNEHYAEAAGLDSPSQIIGKTDDQLPWHKLADYFKAGDYGVLQGHVRTNSPEVSDTINNVTDILVSENQLLTKSGKCEGIIGSFIDITGMQLVKKSGHYDPINKRYYLGKDFGDNHLSSKEVDVFKKIILGYSAKEIGEALGMTRKTAESHRDTIKLKFQAKSKGEIIGNAVQFGLTQIMFMSDIF